MERRRLADCFNAAEPRRDLPTSSLILDAIRLSHLSIKTSAHWEPGVEHAFSAAAGFSAFRLAAHLALPFVHASCAWSVVELKRRTRRSLSDLRIVCDRSVCFLTLLGLASFGRIWGNKSCSLGTSSFRADFRERRQCLDTGWLSRLASLTEVCFRADRWVSFVLFGLGFD